MRTASLKTRFAHHQHKLQRAVLPRLNLMSEIVPDTFFCTFFSMARILSSMIAA
ncbi:MAG: hypothetical protein WBQ57_02620 [Rhodanobacteraceae bacterium]